MILNHHAISKLLAITALTLIASTGKQALASPPSTAFNYQGSLIENGSPSDGPIDMQFKLWNDPTSGAQVGPSINTTTAVTNGLFNESLDFGATSYSLNQALWLEVLVDGQSTGRTQLTATPFALNTRGLSVNSAGQIGIGLDNPASHLDVNGDGRIRGDAFFHGNAFLGSASSTEQDILFTCSSGQWQVGTNNEGNGADANQFYIYDQSNFRYSFTVQKVSGRVGIGTNTPATALDVNGAVTIRGGADLVEGFESSCGTAFEPGTVLSIDPLNPGKLMCADQRYDKKVAGVVSGANGVQPGIRLGQDGVMDGDIPVAMTGRVYVKCSAENGQIKPGDRLTTATLRGHAMKATDPALSDGAVIGKAMTALDESTGMVLVLVNLQ